MVWLAACNILLIGCLIANSRRWKNDMSVWLFAPSTIFCLGLVLRIGIGANVLALMPREWVTSGEYGQYLVTWLYMNDISRIWAIYSVATIGCYILVWWIQKYLGAKGRFGNTSKKQEKSWALILAKGARQGEVNESRKLVHLTLLLVSCFLISAVIEIYSGASDRGTNYGIWLNKDNSPLLAFKIMSRFGITGYFLIPFASDYLKKWQRFVLWSGSSVWPLAGFYFGGRGQAMYPVLAVIIGVLVKNGMKRQVIQKLLVAVLIMLLAVPWIAAYRDSTEYITSNHTALGSRLSAIMNVGASGRLGYRVRALGREFYACSDGFLFTDSNKARPRAGLDGLSAGEIASILTPRLVSKAKVEKNDGSSIAQDLMGVNVDGWFPCITTPGDLFRRGGEFGLIIGGAVMGIVLSVLDGLWRLAIKSNTSTFVLLMSCISVSYIQLNLHGTVSDLIWAIGWDLPKYAMLSFAISLIVRVSTRVFHWPNRVVG